MARTGSTGETFRVLRRGQPAKDAQCQVALALREPAATQDLFHVGQVPVRVFLGGLDGRPGGVEAAFAHFFDLPFRLGTSPSSLWLSFPFCV